MSLFLTVVVLSNKEGLLTQMGRMLGSAALLSESAGGAVMWADTLASKSAKLLLVELLRIVAWILPEEFAGVWFGVLLAGKVAGNN